MKKLQKKKEPLWISYNIDKKNKNKMEKLISTTATGLAKYNISQKLHVLESRRTYNPQPQSYSLSAVGGPRATIAPSSLALVHVLREQW